MNKIICFLFFLSATSYTQTELDQVKKNLKSIQKEFCEKTFLISGSYYSSDIYLIKNNNKFLFKQNSDNQILSEIICDGKNMWSINYEYEEISIYSLTKNEKEKCFFVEQVFNKIDEWKIKENLILIKSNNDWISLKESYSEYIEDYDIGTYNFQEIEKEYNIIGNLNLIWIKESFLLTNYLPPGFNFKLNVNDFLKEYEHFEIIDLR